MRTILFTRNRPLQCRAAIESFEYFTSFFKNIDNKFHCIIDTESAENHYVDIIDQYDRINWIKEKNGFDQTFRKLIDEIPNDEEVLFYCDDQLYCRFVNLEIASKYLRESNDLIGFSVRLGMNIRNRPGLICDKTHPIAKWDWTKAGDHWGYPLEYMGTIYKASLLKELNANNNQEMKCPNFGESFGNEFCKKNYHEKHPQMAMFKGFNNTFALELNRVQDFFPNRIQGTEEHSPEYLKELYKAGFRLNWQALANTITSDIFLGPEYWVLTKV